MCLGIDKYPVVMIVVKCIGGSPNFIFVVYDLDGTSSSFSFLLVYVISFFERNDFS